MGFRGGEGTGHYCAAVRFGLGQRKPAAKHPRSRTVQGIVYLDRSQKLFPCRESVFPILNSLSIRYSGEAYGVIMITETDMSDRSGGNALRRYQFNGAYDEMFSAVDHPRKQYRPLHNLLLSLGPDELLRSKHEADQSFFNQGITFTVYGNDKGTEPKKAPSGFSPTICYPESSRRRNGKKLSAD